MSFPSARCSAVFALASFESDAAAQEALSPVTITGHAAPAEADSDYRATRSSTFTKTDTPLKDVPASITVVPARLMKDQAMWSLAGVIRYVPGASAHQGEGNRDQFIPRGVSTSGDLSVGGVRDDAQVVRDPYNLERVELLKGTAGMIFGRGGAGGVKPGDEAAGVRAGARRIADARQLGPAPRQRRVGDAVGGAAAWRHGGMAAQQNHSYSQLAAKKERSGRKPRNMTTTGPAVTAGGIPNERQSHSHVRTTHGALP